MDERDLDRRNFLKCMAWVGTGAAWTLSSGVLKGSPLEQSVRTPMMPHDALRFVQISDSHIGFDKPANTDVTGTLRAAIDKIKAAPEPPAFVLHISTEQKFKSPVLDSDEQFSHRFDAPGTYQYFCSIHPRMTGRVVVG